MIRQVISLLLAALLLGGCAADRTREASWVVRPRLGVRVKVIQPAELPPDWPGERIRTLRVVRVYAGLPAQRAGIAVGDTLLRLDGATVSGMRDSTMAMDTKRAGDTLVVTLLRDGRRLEVPVRLEAREAGQTP